MMGTGTFAEPTLEALLASKHTVIGLVTQPDRVMGKERGSTRQVGRGMKDIAVERHIPVLQPESINTPAGAAALKDLNADLLVVAAYGQILSKDVLATTPHGGINVHASLLPKYRGAAPVAWAIYHGESETGVTVIKMSVSLDAGDMLAQEKITIGPDETAGELEARLAQLGARLAVQVADQIAAGTAHGLKQDKSLVSKAPKLTKEHGLIDWSRPAEAVCNQVRAMQPWPTAYTFLHQPGQAPLRVIVNRARPFVGQCDPAPCGRVAVAQPGQLLVAGGATGAGQQTVVEILELQPSGKRRMSAADFLRGRPLEATAWLGGESPDSRPQA
ncbi:MAG: methionyl-tRNA formyltransferase [Planctomycetes bacterium]|nr:methionyl-tRNA formyltransferase [Planctomycetota bacterium]